MNLVYRNPVDCKLYLPASRIGIDSHRNDCFSAVSRSENKILSLIRKIHIVPIYALNFVGDRHSTGKHSLHALYMYSCQFSLSQTDEYISVGNWKILAKNTRQKKYSPWVTGHIAHSFSIVCFFVFNKMYVEIFRMQNVFYTLK